MTSDESDEAWWNEVAAYGWKRLDHAAEGTVERFTRWYFSLPLSHIPKIHAHICISLVLCRHPLIIDSIVQSKGLGFVGTDRSTFSVLSRRRVLDWHDGAVRMVLWGKKGADDH